MTKKEEKIRKIEEALDTIRPYLKTDGGDIEVVEITADNLVKVKLLGNCVTCPMSFMTMKAGVEETLKKALPEIRGVEAINVKLDRKAS